MRKTYGTIALALACGLPALALPATYNDWGDVESELVSKKMLHQQIPMRDGVKLDADIYLPHGKPPFPTMLYRSPYIPDLFLNPGMLPVNALNGIAGEWLRHCSRERAGPLLVGRGVRVPRERGRHSGMYLSRIRLPVTPAAVNLKPVAALER